MHLILGQIYLLEEVKMMKSAYNQYKLFFDNFYFIEIHEQLNVFSVICLLLKYIFWYRVGNFRAHLDEFTSSNWTALISLIYPYKHGTLYGKQDMVHIANIGDEQMGVGIYLYTWSGGLSGPRQGLQILWAHLFGCIPSNVAQWERILPSRSVSSSHCVTPFSNKVDGYLSDQSHLTLRG